MPLTFAYECYGDGDVCFVLKDQCRLSLVGRHSFSQGEVINDLLVRRHVEIGMVDEDPGSSHHRLRDAMQVTVDNEDVQVRTRDGRLLLIVKPDLEQCFLRSVRRLGFDSTLPSAARDLWAILNLPRHPKHVIFQRELAALRDPARTRGVPTFVSRLEAVVRRLVEETPA